MKGRVNVDMSLLFHRTKFADEVAADADEYLRSTTPGKKPQLMVKICRAVLDGLIPIVTGLFAGRPPLPVALVFEQAAPT